MRARPGDERVAGLLDLHRPDEAPLVAFLERGAREGVVHPVGDEHRADAEGPHALDAGVDVRPVALRLPLELAAAERVRGLDANDHGELAATNDAPRRPRGAHEAEPPPAATAALGVDVVLQRP